MPNSTERTSRHIQPVEIPELADTAQHSPRIILIHHLLCRGNEANREKKAADRKRLA